MEMFYTLVKSEFRECTCFQPNGATHFKSVHVTVFNFISIKWMTCVPTNSEKTMHGAGAHLLFRMKGLRKLSEERAGNSTENQQVTKASTSQNSVSKFPIIIRKGV